LLDLFGLELELFLYYVFSIAIELMVSIMDLAVDGPQVIVDELRTH